MKTRIFLPFVCGAVAAAFVTSTSAQTILWSENFETDTTANWNVNTLGVGSDANFFFDYSSVGIPKAPHSDASDGTYGMRLRANQFGFGNASFPAGVSVSPIGQSFTGDYILRFDMWLNFIGPAPDGGKGSTQMTGAGIGTAGTSSQIAGGVVDSIFFSGDGDGGMATQDYRVYAPAAPSQYAWSSGVYAAGNNDAQVQNNRHPYYASVFAGQSAPAAQLALYPQQTGTAEDGALGWAWRDVEIAKIGNTVTWTVDGLLLATVDITTAGNLGGGNILFNQYDINATTTDAAGNDLLFGLYDNVVVYIPEPTTGALGLLGAGLLFLSRRRK